jgi:hypothetical protein
MKDNQEGEGKYKSETAFILPFFPLRLEENCSDIKVWHTYRYATPRKRRVKIFPGKYFFI